jgi:hypothetical protein
MNAVPIAQDNMWQVERRGDGALIVRIRSRDRGPGTLPDAVFSFRAGDPQYEVWEQRLRDAERQIG